MTVAGPISPCINICTLDESDICRGCFRSRAEIAGWTSMDAAEQWRVVARAEERRAQAETSRREPGR
jgi:predicted Fe-S protein YdhL (DUF1289 family)